MGILKTRQKERVAGTLLVVGSAGFQQQVTMDGQVRVNTPGLVSAPGSGGFAGYTRLGSAQTSVVISTTAVKSNSLIMIGALIVKGTAPGAQASGSIPGPIIVSTISHGGYFTFAWMGGVGFGENVDIPWKITDQV